MFDCVLLLVHYTPMSSTKVQCSATPWKVTSLPVVTGCGARKLHDGSCSVMKYVVGSSLKDWSDLRSSRRSD